MAVALARAVPTDGRPPSATTSPVSIIVGAPMSDHRNNGGQQFGWVSNLKSRPRHPHRKQLAACSSVRVT